MCPGVVFCGNSRVLYMHSLSWNNSSGLDKGYSLNCSLSELLQTSSTKELPSSTSTVFKVQSKVSSQHTDILGENAWGAVSPLAAPGMQFSLCFLWVSPCAVHTHGFAPQAGASLQDVSVHRMDPDSWAKHVWKTLPYSYKCLVFYAVWFFSHFK